MNFRQFLEEGTKFVYHGTSSKTLEAIRQHGSINPSTAGKTVHHSKDHPSQQGVYVASNPGAAAMFAHSAASVDKSDPVLLKIHRSAMKDLKRDKEYTSKSAYYHPSPIPASAIADVHNLSDHKLAGSILNDHPFHSAATQHGFTRTDHQSSNKNMAYSTYTRPGTMHQGKDYLHLGLNQHNHQPSWDYGMASGKDEGSLHHAISK